MCAELHILHLWSFYGAVLRPTSKRGHRPFHKLCA